MKDDKMVTVTCDKCQKLCAKDNHVYDYPAQVVVANIKLADLCTECHLALKEWLKGGSSNEPNTRTVP